MLRSRPSKLRYKKDTTELGVAWWWRREVQGLTTGRWAICHGLLEMSECAGGGEEPADVVPGTATMFDEA